VQSSLGLVLERVDDPPRIFGEGTLRGDSDAILEFLRAVPVAGHFRYVLENGADVNLAGGKYGNALSAAAGSDESTVEIVRLMLEFGADVNSTHRVPAR
jgi:ankyrin repeat protein